MQAKALLSSEQLSENLTDSMMHTNFLIARYSTEPFAIAVVTPMHRRTSEIYHDSEVMFVDSTGSCDALNTVLTFLLIETPSGGSPIGAVFTQSSSKHAYKAGFALLKEVSNKCP
jgi:hypothetical protein